MWLETDQWAQTNSFPQSMIADYLFSTRFKDASVEQFKEKQNADLRAQVFNQSKIHYQKIKEGGSYFINLNHNNQWFMEGGRQLFDLALFGNADYAGQEIRSEPLKLINYRFISAQYGQSKRISPSFRIAWAAGFGVYTKQQELNADLLSIYTATGGERLELQAKGVQWTRPKSGTDAYGLDLDLYIHKDLGPYQLGFALEDLSLAYGLGTLFAIDTTMDFEGLELSGEDLISGDLGELSDSIINQVLYSDSSRRAGMLLPFRTTLSIERSLDNSQSIGADLLAWSLGKYGWSLGLWHQMDFNQKIQLKTAMGYGNYSGFWWSESVRYSWGAYQAKLSIHGLHHAALPSSSGLMGLSVGLAKAW